jgi:predicted aconitase with swiveling domain
VDCTRFSLRRFGRPGCWVRTALPGHLEGITPAVPVFPHFDSHTAVTDAVRNIPMVTDLKDDPFAVISMGDRVRVDGDDGTVKVIQGLRS